MLYLFSPPSKRNLAHAARFESISRCLVVAGVTAFVVAGCSVFPIPLADVEKDRLSTEAMEKLFAGQEPISRPLTLFEATARAVKYQADHRVRLMEVVAAQKQLDVSQFDLLPRLAVNAGYTARNNDSFGFGFSPGGGVATNPSASVERSHSTASIGMVWNVLDFGVSYFRAKQLADQQLISAERRRKAVQNLVQDVRQAWWRAEAAQRLMPIIDEYFEEIEQSIEKTRIIENRKLLPPMQTASLRRALLDIQQQISLKREELAQAKIELAALVNAPPGSDVRIAPADDFPAARLDLRESMGALESVAIRNRPEVAEEIYKARISESEARKGLLQVLPGVNFDLTGNFDSNRFLVNNYWTSAGIGIAFNLVKIFSIPALNRSADAQRAVDESRRLAMVMAVLTQTRIAAVRYQLMSHEYFVWDEATKDDERIVKFLESSTGVGIDTELELIRAKGRFTISKINRDVMYASLEGALGRLFGSMGLDPASTESESIALQDLAEQLKVRITEWQMANFSAKPKPETVPVAIMDAVGVPAAFAKSFAEGLNSVFEASKINVVGEKAAHFRILSKASLGDVKAGGQPATVSASLIDVKTGAVRFSSEYKTMLSEPVDAEQWRTLGEGAAFRVLTTILRMQVARRIAPVAEKAGEAELKLLTHLRQATDPVEARRLSDFESKLELRMDSELLPPQPRSLSRNDFSRTTYAE